MVYYWMQTGVLFYASMATGGWQKMDAALNTPESKFITIADTYTGKKLSSPNDAVYSSAGELYFTDPPYGLST